MRLFRFVSDSPTPPIFFTCFSHTHSHYVTLSMDDQDDVEKRTQTVHASAAPVYNKKFRFTAMHYRSSIKVTLVDAQTGRKIGQTKISVYSIMQRDADMVR